MMVKFGYDKNKRSAILYIQPVFVDCKYLGTGINAYTRL